MDTKVKFGLYGLYGLAALMVGLYLRFPSDTVSDYAVRQVEGLLPGLEVAVAAARPSLPAAVQLQGIEAQYGNRAVLTLDRARLSPAWGELLRFDPAWKLTAAIGNGRLQALIRAPETASPESVTLLADLDRIDLGELQGLQRLAGRRITGLCSGTVSRTQGAGKTGLAIRLQLTGAAVELKQPIFQRGQVVFQVVQIEADLIGDVLQIRQLTFQGPEFDGRLVGAIDFNDDVGTSTIDLEGAVKPHDALLAQLKRSLPESIMARRGTSGEFGFLLSGSIKNPRYSFR